MPRPHKVEPLQLGAGVLKAAGVREPVTYEIRGDLTSLKLGIARVRGALKTTEAFAADAFRAGEGVLEADDGRSYRLTMLGHSEGSDTVFVELRI
jgi:hypothetical protein